MKKNLRISQNLLKTLITFGLVFCILSVSFLISTVQAEYSNSPRQTGEVVLNELLQGTNKFIVRVASNGGTDKNSFKIDVKKENGLTEKAPHYALTIIRIKPDECKAIVEGGTLILFDLGKDLGLSGDFTYSITNKVYASVKLTSSDESLFSIIEKYFSFNTPDIKETTPAPFTKFVMDHEYFSCDIPADWKLTHDPAGDEKAGIYEINLIMSAKAKPEDGAKYFFPDPFIYVGYYAQDNQQHKTYESFIKDYEELVQKRVGSEESRYNQPQQVKFNGQEATEMTYEVYQEVPRGPLFATKYWLKAKFIMIKAKEGFYILAYKSPREFYDQYLPAFEEVTKTFKSLY